MFANKFVNPSVNFKKNKTNTNPKKCIMNLDGRLEMIQETNKGIAR